MSGAHRFVVGAGAGTDPSEWTLASLGSPPRLELPPPGRVLLLAPHPDDEVLGAGGLLRALHRRGDRIHVSAVTDGEAAFGAASPRGLAATRTAESVTALDRLGLAPVHRERLGLPDGGIAAHEDRLIELLHERLDGCTLVLATWSHDGHPDHEAVGRAARRATGGRVRLLEYPVWAWYWSRPADGDLPPGRLLRWDLDRSDRRAKRHAIGAFRSQIRPRRRAVLPPGVLRYHHRAFETFVEAGTAGR